MRFTINCRECGEGLPLSPNRDFWKNSMEPGVHFSAERPVSALKVNHSLTIFRIRDAFKPEVRQVTSQRFIS
jgi:hypothetical protein